MQSTANIVGVQIRSPFLRLAHKCCHGIWSGSPASLPLSLLRLGIKANRASAALGCQLHCCCILSVNSVMQLARLMLHLDLILLQVHVSILQKPYNDWAMLRGVSLSFVPAVISVHCRAWGTREADRSSLQCLARCAAVILSILYAVPEILWLNCIYKTYGMSQRFKAFW